MNVWIENKLKKIGSISHKYEYLYSGIYLKEKRMSYLGMGNNRNNKKGVRKGFLVEFDPLKLKFKRVIEA